ncbi:MAG: FhaA domain-containing protein [Egibacteraceae bacterium]
MSILRDFEKRLEGAVEGFFARAFRSGLQPIELAKALQRYAANYQQVGVEGVFVPNVYRFTLSQDDVERFSGFSDSLARELADVVRRTAQDHGWQTKGPMRIELEAAPHVLVGTYELRGKAEAARASSSGAHESAPSTGALRVLTGPEVGAQYTLSDTTIIGRLPECDVTLDDPSVSRRHARIVRESNQWTVEDLGSTNGVRVNGEQISQRGLREGDRLEFGGVRLAFSRDAGAGGAKGSAGGASEGEGSVGARGT